MSRVLSPPKSGKTRAPQPAPHEARRLWLISAGVLAGLLGGLVLADSWWQGPAPGATDPGPIVGWGLPLSRALSVGAGALTLGWLLTAAFLAPQGRKGVLSRVGRDDVKRAAWASVGWLVGAALTVAFNHAMMVGQPLWEAMKPSVFATYAFSVDTTVAFAISFLAALVVLVGAPFTSRTGGAFALVGVAALGLVAPGLAGHSHGLGDHGLAMTSGLVHVGATAAWLGSLVAVALHVFRRDPGLRTMLPRYNKLATGSFVALALSGIGAAYTRIEQPGDLFTSEYGWLALVKITLLIGLGFVVLEARRAVLAGVGSQAARGRIWRWLLLEGTILGAGIGVAVAMTRTPNTRIPIPLNSPAEELLGFPFPPEPTFWNALGGWHPDPFWIVVCVVALVAYALGVWTLHKRGIQWPVGRTISWVIGIGLVFWSTNALIAAYSVVSVSLHMLQHMVLAMLAPVFLVMGAPVMLALRAFQPSRSGDRGPREWLLTGLHSGPAKVASHPVYALLVTVIGLYGLYFTGLFPALMSNHLGHVAMQIHFLASGFLFYWVIIGIDPVARVIPYWLKMIVLLLSLALHGFFGIFLMMATEPLGQSWYGLVQPPWLTDPLNDTYVAGGIAWAFGEIPTLIVMIALGIQWARSDAREARRIDRAADRDDDAELKAYNERLAAMNARATKSE